jgi:hypothetical protein
LKSLLNLKDRIEIQNILNSKSPAEPRFQAGGGGGVTVAVGDPAAAADVAELRRTMAELRDRQAAMEATLQAILAAVQQGGGGGDRASGVQ